jgi:lysozyme family protein
MKYIKIFELFNQGEYYEEVSFNDVKSNRIVSFTKSDYDRLKSDLKIDLYFINRAHVNINSVDYSPELLNILRLDCNIIQIGKKMNNTFYGPVMELYIYNYSDEYYFIISQFRFLNSDGTTNHVTSPKLYKCDRLDGLKVFLKDKSVLV